MNKNRIAARVKILSEYFEPKYNKMVDVREFYETWYDFTGKELDVSIFSESWMNKEKTIKGITYAYYPNETSEPKLIPDKHCEIVYKFL